MDLHVPLSRQTRIVFFSSKKNHCDCPINMLQQNYVLSGKIKIAPENNHRDISKHFSFYKNYSLFILKVLRKSSFQEFICYMLLSENIEEKNVNTVDIKVFPAPIKNGFNIVGKCAPFKGRIRIYPKTFNYCSGFRKKYGKDYLFTFVGNRARATLIHELLHLKYISDEKKVEELTDIYFSTYMKKRKRFEKDSTLTSLHDLIFASKKHTTFGRKTTETRIHLEG
jgi:hypothetical protein